MDLLSPKGRERDRRARGPLAAGGQLDHTSLRWRPERDRKEGKHRNERRRDILCPGPDDHRRPTTDELVEDRHRFPIGDAAIADDCHPGRRPEIPWLEAVLDHVGQRASTEWGRVAVQVHNQAGPDARCQAERTDVMKERVGRRGREHPVEHGWSLHAAERIPSTSGREPLDTPAVTSYPLTAVQVDDSGAVV